MKKSVSLILALVMLLGLVACGTAPSTSQAPSSTPADTSTSAPADSISEPLPPKNGEKYVIGISQPFMGHPVRQAGQVLIDAWAAEHPDCEIIVTDGQLNAQKQIADLEDLMARDVDIILVAAHQSPTLVPVLSTAKEAGFPIIAFDRVLTDESVQIGRVINDEVAGGKVCAELMKEALGEEGGDIIVLMGPAGNTGAEYRQQGFEEGIEGSNINIIDMQVADFQRVKAVEIFENLLQANPDLDGVFCHNDEMALGALNALVQAGKKDNVLVVGVDAIDDALQSVKDGKMDATVYQDCKGQAEGAIEAAYKLAKGESVEKEILIPFILVTTENVDEYLK